MQGYPCSPFFSTGSVAVTYKLEMDVWAYMHVCLHFVRRQPGSLKIFTLASTPLATANLIVPFPFISVLFPILSDEQWQDVFATQNCYMRA